MSDLGDWTDGLKYKPGWKFTLGRLGGFPVLTITATVLHSETYKPVTFDIKRLVPPSMQQDAELFVEWVETLLAEAEIHEMREFFRFYNRLVDNPHESVPAEAS